MPTFEDLAAHTVGEQEWYILHLEAENERLRQALHERAARPLEPSPTTDRPGIGAGHARPGLNGPR